MSVERPNDEKGQNFDAKSSAAERYRALVGQEAAKMGVKNPYNEEATASSEGNGLPENTEFKQSFKNFGEYFDTVHGVREPDETKKFEAMVAAAASIRFGFSNVDNEEIKNLAGKFLQEEGFDVGLIERANRARELDNPLSVRQTLSL